MKRILFGFLFAIMGGAMLWWCLSTVSRIRASAGWPATDGEVVNTAIARDSSRIRGGSYNHFFRTDVRYRYTVNGKQYESDTFTFGVPHTFSTQPEAEAEVTKYAVGRHVEVRYDPSNPETASVLPGTVPEGFALLQWTSAAFLAAGLISIGSGIFSKRRS